VELRTARDAIDWGEAALARAGIASARFDAERLCTLLFDLRPEEMREQVERALTAEEVRLIRDAIGRREKRESVEHITGRARFMNVEVLVAPGVIMPSEGTGALVRSCLRIVDGIPAPRISDVGTGCGCVAIVLAQRVPAAQIWALDVDQASVDTAAKNIAKHGLEGRLTALRSDLLDALPSSAGSMDLICANLPYVPTSEIAPLRARYPAYSYVPDLALDGGEDGTALLERFIPQAAHRIEPGRWLAIKVGPSRAVAERTTRCMAESGYREIAIDEEKNREGPVHVVKGQVARR
jgi:release factor glutamine methyltransferase